MIRAVLAIVAIGVMALTLPATSGAAPAVGSLPPIDASLAQLLEARLLASLPPAFEHSVDWGATIRMFDGWEWQRDEGRLRLETRKKEVRHGKWELHRATLVQPRQRLSVRVANLRAAGPGRIALDVIVAAPVHGESRLERWRYGVKMFNYAAEAEGTLHVRCSAEVAVRYQSGKLLGALVVEPRVTAVELGLDDFELQRISKFDGPIVHGFGKSLQGVLARQLRAQEPRVVEQLNAGIAAHPERLRFSLDDLLGAGLADVQKLLLPVRWP